MEHPQNTEVADRLDELAALLRRAKGDRFRVRAYERAAAVLRALPVDVASLAPGELRELRGVGEAIAAMVEEHLRSGQIPSLERLREGEPAGFGALLTLPLIGVRDARRLAERFGGVDALRDAAEADGLTGIDETLAARVRESLRRRDPGSRMALPQARREALELAHALGKEVDLREAIVAGEVRRACDTVGRLDLLLVGAEPAAVLDAVAAAKAVVRVLDRHPQRLAVVSEGGRRADVWATTPERAGTALIQATGPAAHVSALRARARDLGLDLVQIAGAEDEVYAALGLAPVPPEVRGPEVGEEAGPVLVGLGDLRGDLHVHSDWSGDGHESLDDLASAAEERGYAYVAITDHTEDLAINGMRRDQVLARRRELEEVRARHPGLTILDAAELNIGLDGTVDYDPAFLQGFDLCVASVHSAMDQPRARQTDRILAAIANPAVHVIGHPTGRIIGHRPGYEIELEAIAQAAAETGTALEVNGSPARLDLSPAMIRVALRAGATLALSSDAHRLRELDYVHDAVAIARNAGVTPAHVLNCSLALRAHRAR